MIFRDHDERQAVCQTLMEGISRGDLWTRRGPTREARQLHSLDGGWLSAGERVMLGVCFALWQSDETLRFTELSQLDPHNLYAVGSLLASLAVDAMALLGEPRVCVSEWLAEMR